MNPRDAGYLAGLLDGEGYVSGNKKGGTLGFGQAKGPVLDSYLGLLDKYGFKYTVSWREPMDRRPLGQLNQTKWLASVRISDLASCIKLIAMTRPVRFDHREYWEGRQPPVKDNRLEIVEIYDVGYREVVSVQTSTKTFVAEGLFTHNSQAEMCVAASLSGDPNFISTIESGIDIHRMNASKLFRVHPDEVTYDQRATAKNAGFGTLFGISAEGYATRYGGTVERAKETIDGFFSIYPRLREWMEGEWEKARENGFIMTPFGRIRHFDLSASNVGGREWRQIINNPIQSVASDITYTGLLSLHEEECSLGLKSVFWGFIHDSVQVDVHPGELWTCIDLINRHIVQAAMKLPFIRVPITADFEFCAGWGYPMSLTVDEANCTMTITGPAMNSITALRELEAMGARIFLEDTAPDGSVVVVFSPMVRVGSPDHRLGRSMTIF
jgi:hypothetical protein